MKGPRKRNSSVGNEPVTFETVREIARGLPGAELGTSYGTPAFKVGGKLFARQHQDGVSLVIKIDYDQRAMRMKAEPETFYITDHYRNYPWMLVLLSTVDHDDLRDLLQDSWRLSAPKRLLASLERREEEKNGGSDAPRPRRTARGQGKR
jgi:hypothetical protein